MEMTKNTSLAGFKNASAVSFSIVLACVVEELGFQVIFFWVLKPASYYFFFSLIFLAATQIQTGIFAWMLPPQSYDMLLEACVTHQKLLPDWTKWLW